MELEWYGMCTMHKLTVEMPKIQTGTESYFILFISMLRKNNKKNSENLE